MDWTYWSAPVNAYCERTSALFWAEPANALSNISFFLAALIAFIVARRENRLDAVNGILIGLTVLIGTGSLLFHTFAQRWSDMADMMPIAFLAVFYIAFSVRRFFSKSWVEVTIIGFAYFLISAVVLYLVGLLPAQSIAWMNGSEMYIPVVGGLFFLGLFLQRQQNPGAFLMWAGIATFLVSLVFRSLDMALCSAFPLGTHFIWHTLNGVLIGILLFAIIKYGAPAPKKA
ncbi:Arginine/ornithine antiporter ArcD [hydrothermal vent metagenome]|uniref:Arginine/ornithine antiporter ArcD n=1 Tax=hydrothermal vent metagenome TaxID=652676 RepID=A0A3B0U103_9ZZZZ